MKDLWNFIRTALICSDGLEFEYHGDLVWYIWPWLRNKNSYKFVSFGFNSGFASLEAIDEEWEKFHEHKRKLARSKYHCHKPKEQVKSIYEFTYTFTIDEFRYIIHTNNGGESPNSLAKLLHEKLGGKLIDADGQSYVR